jgi:hypothetical protein
VDGQQGELTIERMCILAAVSRAGYYRFCAPGADADEKESRLRDAIQRAAIESRDYGYRRVACLNQRSWSFAGLHDDRCFRQRRHRNIALWEEDPIRRWVRSVVSDDGDLTDHQEVLRQLVLELCVLPRVSNAEGHQATDKLSGPSDGLFWRLSRSHDRDAPALDEIPPALEIQELNRVVCYAQFHRVFARTVDPNSEMGYTRGHQDVHSVPGKLAGNFFRHEIGRNGTGMLAELVGHLEVRS